MIIETSSIVIAGLSFTLSIYVILRDRKNKKHDNLVDARERILNIFDEEEVLTPDEMQEHFEDNPESYEAQKLRAELRDKSFKVDREFEYLCFLVIKKQVDFQEFFNLFHKWLAMRDLMWTDYQQYKQENLPFTWRVIKLSKDKKLLPLKKVDNK
ncbi:MAG: hypothetical protein PHC97_00565 [Patescibacteria group bacterium]|nr:hypothetical protein [Patescibacteria group bacterium]